MLQLLTDAAISCKWLNWVKKVEQQSNKDTKSAVRQLRRRAAPQLARLPRARLCSAQSFLCVLAERGHSCPQQLPTYHLDQIWKKVGLNTLLRTGMSALR